MRDDVAYDFAFSRRFNQEIATILPAALPPRQVFEASQFQDFHEVTDMVVKDMIVLERGDDGIRVALRVRRPDASFEDYPWQFTMRSRRDNDVTTELEKVLNGYGDFFFYGHSNEDEWTLAGWYLLSLDVFRSEISRGVKCRDEIVNINDAGDTAFQVFYIDDFDSKLLINTTYLRRTHAVSEYITAMSVLRSLCKTGNTSWRVSDQPKRVTLEQLWRDACTERLGIDIEVFEKERDRLVRAGKVIRDRPDLPPSLSDNPHWRVYPVRFRKMVP